MQEEPDGEVGAQLAQDAWQELQLVVLHPHGGVGGSDLGYFLSESEVDLAVGVPPLALIDRSDDEVVV